MRQLKIRQLSNIAADALHWLCLAGAVWFILAFAYVAFASMTYPFNLEWMEGQSIDIIQRIMDGKPVYTKPSIDYVPYIYTPLYFYVCALMAEITGIGFFPARLVSTLSAFGVGVLIYAWIRKTNGNWKAGVIGAGLFFATYRLSARWFDNSRVDSLFLFLTFASLFVVMHLQGTKYAALAGILGAAAFFTKQSALGMILPVLGAGLLQDWRQAVVTLGVMVALVVGGVWIYDAVSDGWFSFFVFKVPAGHGFEPRSVWGFWRGDIFRPLSVMLVITQVMVCVFGLIDWKTGVRYTALMLGALGTAWIARLHGYGYINVLMPAHLLLALMGGLAFAYAAKAENHMVMAGLSLAVLWQMQMLVYNPNPLIPTQESVEQGNRFLEELGKIDGDVFIPELQYVQTRAGKKSYALGMAAFDIIRSDLKDRGNVKTAFIDELNNTIVSGRFSAIIPGRMVPTPGLMRHYVFRKKLEYPKEYVSGAINFLRTDLFVRISNANHP